MKQGRIITQEIMDKRVNQMNRKIKDIRRSTNNE